MDKQVSNKLFSDEYFMNEALKEARKALAKGEIPIGAIVVSNRTIIARAHNLTETLHDVTAHAEMQAITAAASFLGGKYLTECVMYVTLEPCVMCAAAAAWAQIGKIVYAAEDEKRGYRLIAYPILHPKTKIESGIMASDCSKIIKDFFKSRRKLSDPE